MKELANTIYWFGCVVAATVLGIGVVDYWFNDHKLTALLSWAVLAALPWLVGRASLFVLAVGARSPHKVKNSDAPALKRDAEEDWARYTALRKNMEELEGLDG
jgi:hypothetical protein